MKYNITYIEENARERNQTSSERSNMEFEMINDNRNKKIREKTKEKFTRLLPDVK